MDVAGCDSTINLYPLPETNGSPLKIGHPKKEMARTGWPWPFTNQLNSKAHLNSCWKGDVLIVTPETWWDICGYRHPVSYSICI